MFPDSPCNFSNAFAPTKCPICKNFFCTKLNYVHQSGYQRKYLWGYNPTMLANAHNNSIIEMPQIDVKKVDRIGPKGNLSREV